MSRVDKLIVFDTETTGVDFYTARIVTAFIGVMLPDGTFEDKWSYLIYPDVEIPQAAIDIHGITNEKAKAEGVDARDGIFSILQRLDILDRLNVPLVAYNAAFDLTLLREEAIRYGYRPVVPKFVVDPFIIDKGIDKYRKGSRKLTDTARHYGIDIGANAHDAEADCIAAGKLAFKMIDNHLSNDNRSSLMVKQEKWAAEQSASLEKYFRKTDDTVRIDGGWPFKAERSATVVSSEEEVKE